MAAAKNVRRKIGFIGAGNMAGALIKGLLTAGLYQPDEILASDVDSKKRQTMRRRYKIGVTDDNHEVVRDCRVVIIAVKPQIIDEILADLASVASSRKLFISIAAGVTNARIEKQLGGGVRVLRVMPNTPALLGKGMSVLARGKHATAADERLGLRLLRAVGDAIVVPKEKLLDPVTGLSGSGPAYVYRFAEGLIAGGRKAGLSQEVAERLAFQTIAGAAAMLLETGESPEVLRARVTSPGGTTFAGLTELERLGFKDAVASGVVAATRRSVDLGKK